MVPFSYFHELIQTILASFHCVQSIICSIFLKYINITFYHFDYSHNWPYPNIGVGVVASMSSACWNLLQGTRVESSLDLLGPLSKGLTWNRFRSALACEIEIQIGHALTNTDAAIKWSFYIFREEHEQEYIGRGCYKNKLSGRNSICGAFNQNEEFCQKIYQWEAKMASI